MYVLVPNTYIVRYWNYICTLVYWISTGIFSSLLIFIILSKNVLLGLWFINHKIPYTTSDVRAVTFEYNLWLSWWGRQELRWGAIWVKAIKTTSSYSRICIYTEIFNVQIRQIVLINHCNLGLSWSEIGKLVFFLFEKKCKYIPKVYSLKSFNSVFSFLK